jgi:protein-S-isoprenylcysteine O-methyltransferase Ste14
MIVVDIHIKALIVLTINVLLVLFRNDRNNPISRRINISVASLVILTAIFSFFESSFKGFFTNFLIFSVPLLVCLIDILLTMISFKLNQRDFHAPNKPDIYSGSYFGPDPDDKLSDHIIYGVLIVVTVSLPFVIANLFSSIK